MEPTFHAHALSCSFLCKPKCQKTKQNKISAHLQIAKRAPCLHFSTLCISFQAEMLKKLKEKTPWRKLVWKKFVWRSKLLWRKVVWWRHSRNEGVITCKKQRSKTGDETCFCSNFGAKTSSIPYYFHLFTFHTCYEFNPLFCQNWLTSKLRIYMKLNSQFHLCVEPEPKLEVFKFIY